jgi:hypothetical protein
MTAVSLYCRLIVERNSLIFLGAEANIRAFYQRLKAAGYIVRPCLNPLPVAHAYSRDSRSSRRLRTTSPERDLFLPLPNP